MYKDIFINLSLFYPDFYDSYEKFYMERFIYSSTEIEGIKTKEERKIFVSTLMRAFHETYNYDACPSISNTLLIKLIIGKPIIGFLILFILSIIIVDKVIVLKKLKLLLISWLLLPINVFAYSNYIIPGGETLGIEVNSKGVMVIGFYQINGKFNKGAPAIKAGDYIVKINDVEVNTINELTKEIEANVDVGEVNVELRRDGKTRTSKLELVKDGEIYKTGLYVKDSIAGTGTLTYIDPETKIFGALGHEIIESNTNSIVEVKDGSIFRNYITGIDKSKVGYAGSKNAKFYYNTKYGTINKNTNVGIYGIYDSILPNKEKLEVADKSEIKIGKASIATVLSKEEIKYYDIEITKIDEYAKIKNISFKITDKELLDKTGGVVQGMSGSPIMQNGKIIGAVTHVIIDNPTIGYGLFITTMLDEGEK